MATSSFDEMMVIDTPEAAENLYQAYLDAVRRGPLKLPDWDIDEIIRESEEFLTDNPDWFSRLAENARQRMIARGIDPEEAMKEVVWPDDL